MKTLAWTMVLFASFPLSLMAQSTKEDIKKLVSRGVPESVVLNYIAFKGPPTRLSVDDIVELKQAGATDRIIAALMAPPVPSLQAPVSPPAQNPPAPSDPTIPTPPDPLSPILVGPPNVPPPATTYDPGMYDTNPYPYNYYPLYYPRPIVIIAPYPLVVPGLRYHQSSSRQPVGNSSRGGSDRGNHTGGGSHH